MSSYNTLERSIAFFLSKTPKIKKKIKLVYEFFNYAISFSYMRPKSFSQVDVKLLTEKGSDCYFGYYDKPAIRNGCLIYHKKNIDTVEILYKKIRLDGSQSEAVKIGESALWNWQQGSMLTWIDDYSIGYNKISDGMPSLCIFNLDEKKERIISKLPLQAYSEERQEYISIDYFRLTKLRPDYGYSVLTDDAAWNGIAFKIVCLKTRSVIKEVRYKEIVSGVGFDLDVLRVSPHKVNHFKYSACGKYLVFMFRYFVNDIKYTSVYCMNFHDDSIVNIYSENMFSHYDFVMGEDAIIAWCRISGVTGYYKIGLLDQKAILLTSEEFGGYGDGHPSIKRELIITDTYPGRDRHEKLILFNTVTNKSHIIGSFWQGWRYRDLIRCDLHPRWDHDSMSFTFDSTHKGFRGVYHIKLDEELSR